MRLFFVLPRASAEIRASRIETMILYVFYRLRAPARARNSRLLPEWLGQNLFFHMGSVSFVVGHGNKTSPPVLYATPHAIEATRRSTRGRDVDARSTDDATMLHTRSTERRRDH